MAGDLVFTSDNFNRVQAIADRQRGASLVCAPCSWQGELDLLVRQVREPFSDPNVEDGLVHVVIWRRGVDMEVQYNRSWGDLRNIVNLGFPLQHWGIEQDEGGLEHSRAAAAFGERFVQARGGMRVGVVGLGKLGHPVFESLLGRVDTLVGVDNDRIFAENLNYLPAAPRELLGRPKTEYYELLARSHGQPAQLVNGDVCDPETSQYLKNCRVIFCCADSQLVKQHLLDLCMRYGIVLIESGIGIELDDEGGLRDLNGAVNTVVPGIRWCLFCARTLDLERCALEAMDEDESQYARLIGLLDERESRGVGALSRNLAATAVMQFDNLLAGFRPFQHRVSVDWLSESIQAGEERLEPQPGCPYCSTGLLFSGDRTGIRDYRG